MHVTAVVVFGVVHWFGNMPFTVGVRVMHSYLLPPLGVKCVRRAC